MQVPSQQVGFPWKVHAMLQSRKLSGRFAGLRVLLVLPLLFAVTAKALPAMGDLQASAVAAPGARQDTLAASEKPGHLAEIGPAADTTATGGPLKPAGKLIGLEPRERRDIRGMIAVERCLGRAITFRIEVASSSRRSSSVE